jgi:hypothetical protein
LKRFVLSLIFLTTFFRVELLSAAEPPRVVGPTDWTADSITDTPDSVDLQSDTQYDPNKDKNALFSTNPAKPKGRSPVKITGKYRLAAGLTGDDFIVNESQPLRQERDFNYIFGERLNNTYDPAVFSQVLVNVDYAPHERFNFYTQLVADPWSVVGTTGEQVQTSDIGGEVIRYNLRTFGADNSTMGTSVRANTSDYINIPRIKLKDGKTTSGTVAHGFFDFNADTGGIPFTIPELDIDYEVRPIRKLWMDYTADEWHARVFALADESQALTSDDPLELSNHKDYWQQSPWLDEYVPIQYFSDGSIKRGYYSDSTAFSARDSDGNRLVLLKGASVEADLGRTYFAGTIAAPQNPWEEEYFTPNSVSSAFRIKHISTEKLTLGALYTSKTGYVNDSVSDISQVLAVDTKYKINDKLVAKTEIAGSYRERDRLSNLAQITNSDGMAYKAVLNAAFPNRLKGETAVELSYAQMDRYFDPMLSRYSNTRDDHFWGKHLSFREYSPDLEHYRIGDGLDVNRRVYRARWQEKLYKDRFVNLFDVRHVRNTHTNDYMENVMREEVTFKMTPKMTIKGMFRWQDLPKSEARIEPYLSNYYFPLDTIDLASMTIQNVSVPGRRDPSHFTYAGGAQYVFNKKWTAEGIVERSNDLPDFPRGLLNGTFRDANDRVDGILTDHVTTFLYSQGPLGGVPPYEYFSIIKERLYWRPENNITVTFHATQNGYKFYGGIDDNINHQGVSVAMDVSKKLSLFADYTHSVLIDLPRQISNGMGTSDLSDHHNLYGSLDYRINAATVFRAEYGVFGLGSDTPQVTPYSTSAFSLPTIDTEHLLRVSLTGDF